jgi:hypothetical protein
LFYEDMKKADENPKENRPDAEAVLFFGGGT